MVNTNVESAESNALATIVGRLGTLTESELSQLYLIVGVRLGVPGGTIAGKTRSTVPASGGKAKAGGSVPKKSSGQGPGRGNPHRKSQWANHPLWKEYSRLKKVVEAQAKEAKTSFNAVDTPERRAYQQAFIQWMEAKSSFRDRKTTTKGDDSDEESEDEDEEQQAQRASSSGQRIAGPSGSPAERIASGPPVPPTKAGAKGTSTSAKPKSTTGKAPSK